MYQPLGDIYNNQRIGSFESDGTSKDEGLAARAVRWWNDDDADDADDADDDTSLGRWGRGRGRRAKKLSNEQLADRLARKEMKLVRLQQKASGGNAHAAKALARMEPHVADLRAELAARKNPEALNGLGTFDMKSLSPLQLGVGAVIGAGIYWFVVKPRLR